MLSKFENFESLPDGGQINRAKSFKYLGVTVDEKWSWKCDIKTLLRKLGHRLSVFNWISHMLDRRTRMAYFNGLVLPHCDYADIVWGDQPGLESEMERLQAFQNRFAKKIDGSKQSSAEAMAVHSSGSHWLGGVLDIDVLLFKMQSKEISQNTSILLDLL